jgi:thymidylate kinase
METMEQQAVLDLIAKLCNTLATEKIDYCHWKSNTALDRSARGENDLDLLINRAHAQRFTEILYKMGFKEARPAKDEELPGILDYYGFDRCSGRLVHVHAHFQLILGNDLEKNYRLPIEQVYLEAASQGDVFRVPAPEFELVVLVIRMALKHSTWDSILMGHGKLSRSEQNELDDLTTRAEPEKVNVALASLALIDRSVFDAGLQSLQPNCPFWKRINAGGQLQKKLHVDARSPHLQNIITKFFRRIWQPIRGRVFKIRPNHRSALGGLLIAIVGGDGAGKTTAVDELHAWLLEVFDTEKVHMGKPAWSWTTIIMRGILKIGTVLHLYPFEGDIYEESLKQHGTPWFIRAACTARDRYLTYFRARRSSSNGKLVLCDRYSFPGFMNMDGPQCENAASALGKSNRFINTLTQSETSFYQKIGQPDLLIVLKLDPELAVKRKVDETNASVRARCTEVWELDWSKRRGFVIDASQSKEEVLTQVKALVWSHL